MPNIQVLDQNTINQIAAGEVIERPASVVKELLENAIDAKATAVTIEIKNGGISLIRITDNGCGIEKEEVPLAFLRHSTSKIRSAADLLTVSSLGFRGEALSSIASIASVELITKTPSAQNGVLYEIEDGKEKRFEEIGSPEGTTFLVKDIFSHIPARRKFLKTPQTEAGYIGDIIEHIALSHPEISIRFINNGQNKLHTSGNRKLKDVIYVIYGRDIAANVLPVNASMSYLSLSGFLGKPVITRGNRTFENYFVNGRYIRSSLISKAIEEAYQPFLMQHKYPFTVCNLSIDPEYLDVNVHPAKMELRFREEEEIYTFILNTIRETLSQKELIPETQFSEKNMISKADNPIIPSKDKTFIEKKNILKEPTIPSLLSPREKDGEKTEKTSEEKAENKKQEKKENPPIPIREKVLFVRENTDYEEILSPEEKTKISEKAQKQSMPEKQMELFDDKLLEKKNREKHRIIGQIFDTYWIVEFKDKLFFIDQHAAHEKVLFEQTMATLKTREFTSQILNPPIVLTLSINEEALLKQYLSCFTDIGFEIEPFGGKEYAIRAIPDNLFGIAQKDIFLELLASLSSQAKPENSELIYERVAAMSCKAAVKGKNHLTNQEAESLIDALFNLANPYHCPHGRPTIISMSKREIEKKFKRIL